MTAKQELADHWSLIVIAFLLVFVAFGVPTYSMPFIYGAAMEELGWSNTQVNLLSTAKFVIGAGAAVGMGVLIDRVGGRWTVLLGTATGGVAMGLFLFATNLPVYYLAGAVLGFSSASIVAAMKVMVARVFTTNGGLAIGLVLTATSAAGIVMPLVWPPLLDVMNWRQILGMFSLGPLLIAVPMWLIFMAANRRMSAVISAPTVRTNDLGVWGHFKQISKERGFWLIAIGIFLVSAVDQALMQNYVSFLRFDKGMDLGTTISWAGALLAVIGVVAKIGSGWFFDRYSIRGITAFWLLLAISIFLGLPVTGVATLLLFIITRGIAHGGMIVDAPVLSRHYFGLERIGLTMGIVELCVNLGFAAGPPIFGWFADTYGNFSIGLVVYGCVALVGTALLLPVKPRFWTPPTKESRVGHAAQPATVP
jgi:MFS family permease